MKTLFLFNSILLLAVLLSGCGKNKETEATITQKAIVSEKAEDTLAMSHDELMKSITIQPHTIKTIGILVYEGVNSLDVFGPRYVLKQLMGVDVKMIALKPGNVKTVMGIEFVPDATITEISHLDILVIPGGFTGTLEGTYNEDLLQWIREIDQTTQYTTSVCTGGWILGSTGLLKGKKATTNWFKAEEMLTQYGAQFTSERFTKDGKYWTSAGVTAGMDMSLALVEEIAGTHYAQAVMLDMEYDPAPPVTGGSPEKTDPEVLTFMTQMYSAGFDAVQEQLKNKKSNSTE